MLYYIKYQVYFFVDYKYVVVLINFKMIILLCKYMYMKNYIYNCVGMYVDKKNLM